MGGSCVSDGVTCYDGKVIKVSLGDCNLSGNLPTELAWLISLEELNLKNNLLTGTLPSVVLNSMSSLKLLELNNNLLSGSLPEISSSTIEKIWLHINKFSGSIPNSYADLISLEDLQLHSNSLKGQLPDKFAQNLTRIQTLNLSNNQLSGNLSSGFNFIKAFETINVSNNNFTGFIPSDMTVTSVAEFAMNRFTGGFPSSYCQVKTFSFDCNLDCFCLPKQCLECFEMSSITHSLVSAYHLININHEETLVSQSSFVLYMEMMH